MWSDSNEHLLFQTLEKTPISHWNLRWNLNVSVVAVCFYSPFGPTPYKNKRCRLSYLEMAKNCHPPESQVSKVTGDCNALKKPSWSTQVQTSEVLSKGFQKSSCFQKRAEEDVPPKIYFTPSDPTGPPHPIFFFHGCFENPSHRHFPLRKWSCYNRSWPKRLWILPIFGTFGMVGDGGSRESGFNSRVVLSYPGNGG